ncbi:MAG TPA: diacylglycerol kinase family protein [Marmoricola sp.]|nr:diacylglycerol kinase family protein [Marmoricola sp.]
MDPLLMITNADAGTAEEQTLEAALDVLRAHTSVEVCATGDPGELDGALHRAGSRPIVVAGGDGSIHAVVSALHRRHDLADRVLALLPLGTGNDFARTVGIPLDPAEAAMSIVTGVQRSMDLIVDELGEVVVNNVHAGASTAASRRGARWKERLAPVRLGILGYPIGAAISAVKPPFVRLHIEVDGDVVADMDRHVMMVAIGNGATVGGGTALTPHADPQDGKVDVMVSFATGPLSRIGFVASLLREKHHERDDVIALRGTSVTLAGEDFWITADGEISGPETRRTWHLEPAAYTMIVPESPVPREEC